MKNQIACDVITAIWIANTFVLIHVVRNMGGMDIREQNGGNKMITKKEIPTIRCIKCGCVYEFDVSNIKKVTKTIREDVGAIIPRNKNINDRKLHGIKEDIWDVLCGKGRW